VTMSSLPTADGDFPVNPPRIAAVNSGPLSMSNSRIWVIGGLVGIVLFGLLIAFLIWFYFVGTRRGQKEETQIRLYRETNRMKPKRVGNETKRGRLHLFSRSSGRSGAQRSGHRERSHSAHSGPLERGRDTEREAMKYNEVGHEHPRSAILLLEGTASSDSSEMDHDFEIVEERKYETLEELREVEEPSDDEEDDDEEVGLRPKVRFGTISAGDSDAHSRLPTINISVNGPRKWSKDDIEIGCTVSRFHSGHSVDADSREDRLSAFSGHLLFPHVLPRGSDVDEMDSLKGDGSVPRSMGSSAANTMMDTVAHNRDAHLTVDSADIAAVMKSLSMNHVKSCSAASNETSAFISNGEMESSEDDDTDTVDTVIRMDDGDLSSDGNSTIVSMEEAKRLNSVTPIDRDADHV